MYTQKSSRKQLISSVPIPLIIALSQIGTKEISGEESNSQINEYLKTVGQPSDDSIPWCSAFINWCLEQAGIKGTGSPAARSFSTWGTELIEPAVGCIVVLKRGTQSWQGHVGFYLSNTSAYIYLLGGNQSDSVCITPYLKESVISYRQKSLNSNTRQTRREVN